MNGSKQQHAKTIFLVDVMNCDQFHLDENCLKLTRKFLQLKIYIILIKESKSGPMDLRNLVNEYESSWTSDPQVVLPLFPPSDNESG